MIWSKGRRLFSAACVAVILVSAAHTIGHMAPPSSFESDPEFVKLETAIDGFHAPLGMGMTPSFRDIHMGLVFTMTASLLSIGILGLVFAADRAVSAPQLTKLAAVFAVTSAGMTGIYWFYRIPPPLVSLAFVTLLYAVSIRTTRT